MKQDTYTLHKPIQRNFKRNRVIAGGIDQQWQMDLADMQSHKSLMMAIDICSYVLMSFQSMRG